MALFQLRGHRTRSERGRRCFTGWNLVCKTGAFPDYHLRLSYMNIRFAQYLIERLFISKQALTNPTWPVQLELLFEWNLCSTGYNDAVVKAFTCLKPCQVANFLLLGPWCLQGCLYAEEAPLTLWFPYWSFANRQKMPSSLKDSVKEATHSFPVPRPCKRTPVS